MKIADYLNKFSNEEIIDRIIELYNHQDNSIRDGYNTTLDVLRSLSPTHDPNNFSISVELFHDDDDSSDYIHVSLLDQDGVHWGPCGHFSDRLNEEIISPEWMDDIDVISHILWELTFYGFTEDQIADTTSKWMSEINSILE